MDRVVAAAVVVVAAAVLQSDLAERPQAVRVVLS
jgi:hypothetical protein